MTTATVVPFPVPAPAPVPAASPRAPGILACRFAEIDFSGIEAVLTGWFMGDPDYIRLAKLGVHAYLTSHLVHEPANLAWSDADLAAYFAQIKKAHPAGYDKAKRNVHGNNYGLTPYGMALQFPDIYHSVAEAEAVQRLYYTLAPGLPTFQKRVQKIAGELHVLGGREVKSLRDGSLSIAHPYGYRHWFWAVYTHEPITVGKAKTYAAMKKRGRFVPEVITLHGRYFRVRLGDDAKRAIAFFPQSTAAGVIAEAQLLLFDPDSPYYIGDAYFGRTPLRAPIHDSLLLEIPWRKWDRTMERALTVMTREVPELPIPLEWRTRVPSLGACLSIGVEAKAGNDSWSDMEKINLADYRPYIPTVPTDAQIVATPVVQDGWMPPVLDDEDEDEERTDLMREALA